MGLQNNFTYKQFDLGVFLFARWGQFINAKWLGRFSPDGVRKRTCVLQLLDA